ncbi:MAG: hypothetical protein HFJ30_10570 [Clostridia bacterium]|nr:hypothetical protein [Clostridia bacterium]MCI9413335.1 hypothetical protein [Clostridia bacterium]
MQENDDKKGASIAIENLKKLLEFHQISLERWENSEYCYTDVGREMIQTFHRLIQETQAEIEAYEQYKNSGVFVTRQAREMLAKARSCKEDENERE